jgi:histidyl-tRNA synthetase
MELKLKFTDKENVPYVLIFEEAKLASGLVKLKNALTGEEKTIEITAVADVLSRKTDSRCTEYIGGIH